MESPLIPVVNLSCRANFTVSHHLNNSFLTNTTNKKVYGVCNNLDQHLHTFSLEAITRGKINSSIGTVMSLTELKDIVRRTIVNELDGKDLEKEVNAFKTMPSTMENLAVFVWNKLKQEMNSPELLHEIKLMDDEANCVIYNGQGGYTQKKGQTMLTSDTD